MLAHSERWAVGKLWKLERASHSEYGCQQWFLGCVQMCFREWVTGWMVQREAVGFVRAMKADGVIFRVRCGQGRPGRSPCPPLWGRCPSVFIRSEAAVGKVTKGQKGQRARVQR